MITRTRSNRLIAGLAATIAIATLAVGATSSPAAAANYWTTPNTAQTATGAYLQSSGVCGYGKFDFTVTSYGFEYLQVGVAFSPGAAPIWSAYLPVGQSFRSATTVPAFAGRSYYIRGWDWSTQGWLTSEVLTSFWYPNDGTNRNGC